MLCFGSCCFYCYLFVPGILTTLSELFLTLGGTATLALGAGNNVDNDPAVVFATIRACAVRDAQLTAFALRKTHTGDRVVAPAHCSLGAVLTHSYYHGPTIAY